MNKAPHLIVEEKKSLSENTILIVDKIGVIGEALVYELSSKSLVVFVSQKDLTQSDKDLDNVVFVPYSHKFPSKIPDSTYSHIFLIDDNTSFCRESTRMFIKKAILDKALFIFVSNLFEISEKIKEDIVNAYGKSKVVIYGDLFGKDIIGSKLNFPTVVNKFIYQAGKYGRVEINGDGLGKTYPVFFDDVILGILTAAFGLDNNSNIFYLFPKDSQTQLSLAHALHKFNPLINIDFIKGEKEQEKLLVNLDKGEYLLNEKYNLVEKFRQIDFDSIGSSNLEEGSKIKNFDKKGINLFKYFLLFFLALILLPIICPLFFSFLGQKVLEYGKSSLENGKLHAAANSIALTERFFNIAYKTSTPLLTEARFIGKEEYINSFTKNITIGREASLGIDNFLKGTTIFYSILAGHSKKPKEDLIKAENLFKNSMLVFKKLETDKNVSYIFNTKLRDVYSLINMGLSSYDILPEIFGIDRKRTYLVLFQNNMELRPGGGFIGSYGLLTLDKGKLTDFSIHDVYDADGQLKGHVEPPYPIRRYLPSVNWYLRDSNFDIDFVKSASSAANLLSLEIGDRVDGVVGLDINFVKSILSAIGSVYVADYKENVNADNLFKTTEMHVEKNFFGGSTQKKDFLRSLFTAIQLKLSSGNNFPYLTLAKALVESIGEKHILFAFSDQQIQDVFTINNWSGSSWDNRKEKDNGINDFLAINEANLGGNKANYFIERSVSDLVNIDDKGNFTKNVSVAYKNTSSQWPGGDYKNYLRFVLPLGAKLLEISIDGISQIQTQAITNPSLYEAKNFKPPKELEVEKTEEDSKTIYGFLITVASGESKTIAISYALAKKISLDKPDFSYNLFLVKQPGIDKYPYSFSLSYPDSFKPIRISDGVTNKDGDLLLKKNLMKDTSIDVNFARK